MENRAEATESSQFRGAVLQLKPIGLEVAPGALKSPSQAYFPASLPTLQRRPTIEQRQYLDCQRRPGTACAAGTDQASSGCWGLER